MPRDVSQNAPVTDSDRLVIKPRRKVVCSLLACQFVYLMKFTLRRRILGAADSGTMSICQGLDKSMLFWRNYTCMYIRQVYTLKIDKKRVNAFTCKCNNTNDSFLKCDSCELFTL